MQINSIKTTKTISFRAAMKTYKTYYTIGMSSIMRKSAIVRTRSMTSMMNTKNKGEVRHKWNV